MRRLFAIALACVGYGSTVTEAAFVTTDPSVFAQMKTAGGYFQNFNVIPSGNYASGASITLAGFRTTFVTLPGTFYISGGADRFAGNFNANQPFTINLSGNPVSAIGGNFFITDAGDAFQPVPVTINLSDGTNFSFSPGSQANSFVGFIAGNGVTITSLTMAPPGASLFNSVDNLDIGISSTPAPASLLLGLVAVPVVGYIRRKRS